MLFIQSLLIKHSHFAGQTGIFLTIAAGKFISLRMALYVASINSGSNGNCYYVGNQQEAVLVDAGISCREIERRMSRLGLPMERVKALFVSHEHSDHIQGVEVLSRKHGIPVYINQRTLQVSGLKLQSHLVQPFHYSASVALGALKVKPFPKYHDAADPYSFTVSHQGITVGVFTDIGHACGNVVNHFSECHAAFLETNYDEEMLDSGAYPLYLKRRIKSDKGHLSNRQSLELFKKHKAPYLSHLFLSHLSKENNSPHMVRELFEQHAGATKITVASRNAESALYLISGNGAFGSTSAEAGKQEKGAAVKADTSLQMKLF